MDKDTKDKEEKKEFVKPSEDPSFPKCPECGGPIGYGHQCKTCAQDRESTRYEAQQEHQRNLERR